MATACTPSLTAVAERRLENLLLVERDQHLALGVHALRHLEAQVALDQRLVLLEEQIVGVGPVDAADLVDVAEALASSAARSRGAGALQDGVDRDRRAVQEQLRRGEARCRPCATPLLDAGDEPLPAWSASCRGRARRSVSSNAATSVKVPPMSADRRMAESTHGSIHERQTPSTNSSALAPAGR